MKMHAAKVMIRFIFRIAFLGLVLLLLASSYSFAYHFMFRAFGNVVYDKNNDSQITVTVSEEDSNSTIAKHLEQAGIVEDSKSTFVRMELSKYKNEIKPGSYELSASMHLDDVLRVLSKETDVTEEAQEE